MAAGVKLALAIALLFSYFPKVIVAVRYGHPPATLHTSSLNYNERSNDGMHLLSTDGSDAPHERTLEGTSKESRRFVRSTKSGTVDTVIEKSVFVLPDSHTQLIVHWAGQGSKVIVTLAGNSNQLRKNGTAVFISYDYGKSFTNKSQILMVDDKIPCGINKFYNSPVFNSHYIFTDIVNKYAFTTMDFGKSFSKTPLRFAPDIISLHSTNERVILAMDKNDTEKKLWLSEDFGETWDVMQMHVKSFFWGVKGFDDENILYVERVEPSGQSSVLKSPDFFKDEDRVEILITGVEDFQVQDKYMFATRRRRLLGSKLPNGTLELWVSHKRGPFERAQFPNMMDHIDYYIPDATEDQVFVCVNHKDMHTNLYISDTKGIEFSLSLERILYYSPQGAGSDTWLSFVADDTFADFHKVVGLRGIYIASQLKPGFEKEGLGPEDLITVITFDKGGEWRPLKPPLVDQDGKPTHCTRARNCSLHLTQKFSQLYPVSRATPILSRSSAIGLIMASGVLGKSLKGHPAVFLSADAGSSWHKVLDGSYFYIYGDHGGVIVAVKAYKGEGATNEFVYSTDEGESWQSVKFMNETIRVYGLMNEPGGRSTTFTFFGSRPEKHQWVIITVNLSSVFGVPCVADDYKLWSPSDPLNTGRQCLLGQQEVYQRRIPHAKCYNGLDYERVVSVQKCECRLEDYECDVGFKWNESTPPLCVLDKSSNINPYIVPSSCKPGEFYKRSRGYRKIAGDVCEGGLDFRYDAQQMACPVTVEPEFVLFTQRHIISRMPLALEGHIERLPMPTSLKNVIAIEYDFQQNCIYWADIDEDKIMGLCLNGTSEPEVLVETGLSSIEGLALDWHSNNLYFVDGEQSKIEVIRTDIRHLGRMRRSILNNTQVDKPRGIALTPVKGYMFWTEWGSKPGISRASLDGSNIEQLVIHPTVYWPNGVVIDNHIDRIYWVDAKLDYIASADFDGRNMKYLIRNSEVVPHPFAIAIYKDWMYWDDWTRQAILMANKFDGSGVRVVASGLTGIMDLKIYDRGIQEGPNPCQPKLTSCTHLCMARPEGGSVCLCPDGFQRQKLSNQSEVCLCDAGEKMMPDGSCHSTSNTCAPEQFRCGNSGNCIPASWRCDGDDDCEDKSDEVDCAATSCASNQFRCDNGRCIPHHYKCDMDRDCEDGSDEAGCKYSCSQAEFTCTNGRCINKSFQCDMQDDCQDGSDEVNCTSTEKPSTTCQANEFRCISTSACIHSGWKCDGESDCPDGSDETHCSDHTCQPWQFLCKGTGTCIFATWRCDGDMDCADKSDEQNCPTITTPATNHSGANPTTSSGSCSSMMFACTSGNCIPLWWRCDRVSDCPEGSDEFDCVYATPSDLPSTRDPSAGTKTCGLDHFQCSDGECIWNSWVCDGEIDCRCDGQPGCVNGIDEIGCSSTCGPDHFRCVHSAGCVPKTKRCDSERDCTDGSDEEGCFITDTPNMTTPACEGNDESSCQGAISNYSITSLEVDVKSITDSSFGILWASSSNATHFAFLPSISESKSNVWKNSSGWIGFQHFVFSGLKPFTRYNFTVYVKDNGTGLQLDSLLYKQATTLPGVPSPPVNVLAALEHSHKINVTWQPPLHPNNVLLGFRIYISPPVPPQKRDIIGARVLSESVDTEFQPGGNYSVWVTAIAEGMESNASNVIIIRVPVDAIIDSVKDLRCSEVNNITATLNWTQLKQQVDSYVLTVVPKMRLSLPEIQTTKAPPYEVTGLAPGAVYTIKVAARKGDLTGPPTSVLVKTTGDRLKVPRNIEGRVKGNAVQLSWELPHDNRNVKWIYGIKYGFSEEELEQKDFMNKTQELSYISPPLVACKKYLFDVRIVGPYGLGPSEGGILVTTAYDPAAPPVGLNVEVKSGNCTAIVSWKSSCDAIIEKIGYKILIYDDVQDKESRYQMTTNKAVVRFPLIIQYGGHYTIQVQTTHNHSTPTVPFAFHGPSIPSPNQLKVLQTSEGSFELMWSSRELPAPVREHKYSFVVLVSYDINLTDAAMYESNGISMPLDSLLDGRQYYIAVQVKDGNGFTSEPSEVLPFVKPLGHSSIVLSSTSLVGVCVPIIVVVIVLMGALGFLYMRHRRLQRATLSFANSHYNTRSGATTFSTSDDLDEEEDSPMIHGFSDDEPLVIA